MKYADIHCHVLFAVDDGAKTESEMYKIVDKAYLSRTRIICCTPHFHLGYFGNNTGRADSAYTKLSSYISKKYPDISLYSGNELRYCLECIEWLGSGACKTLNGTKYVLTDFSEQSSEKEITQGLNRLLNAGYIPVLAHSERYSELFGKTDVFRGYRENGILLQADAQSPFYGFGFRIRCQCRKLLGERMIDLISSDAHDCGKRPPEMDRCFEFIENRYGREYAEDLCWKNAVQILDGETVRKGIFQ